MWKKTQELNVTMPKSYRLALIHNHWCFVSSDAGYLFAEQVHFIPFMFTNCMYNTIYITEVSFFLPKIFHLSSNAIWPPGQREAFICGHISESSTTVIRYWLLVNFDIILAISIWYLTRLFFFLMWNLSHVLNLTGVQWCMSFHLVLQKLLATHLKASSN